MKIVIVSPNFRRQEFWRRWWLLAENHADIDVVLLAPANWTEGMYKGYTFGREKHYEGISYNSERFKVIPITMSQNLFGDWTSKEIGGIIKRIKPDFVYFIGHHAQMAMMQTLRAAKRYSPAAKRLTFTMRSDANAKKSGKGLKSKIVEGMLTYVRSYNLRNSDAIFCHYPDALNAIVSEGYTGPVYMNTQIGVDTEIFHYKPDGRERIRKKYNICDDFVFGSATRFNPEKGILDILHALPPEKKWKYMILGSGNSDEIQMIKDEIVKLGYENRVIMPGLIEWDELPDYLSALDCAVHVPRTTVHWKETFSIALVQAIAVGVPLIGNTSGSVPYQCGPDSPIAKEGDIMELRELMSKMIDDPSEAKIIGEKQQAYVVNSFGIEHLTECFYSVLCDIADGIYDKGKIDTVK